jgi:Clostripain family
MGRASANRKPWAVLAYTVADDKRPGDSVDSPVKEELKALCAGADFDQVSLAVQVDFTHSPGVYRSVLTAAPDVPFGFEEVPADSHPLWRSIAAKLERSTLRVLAEDEDLNAARGQVLQSFLRFGARECPADRYVVFFYGHAFGPMGLFFDNDRARPTPTRMGLPALGRSLGSIEGRAAVVVFRDCCVNTLETAYELRDVAEFMIASQSIVPIAGVWPWDTFLTALMPGAPSGDVGKAIGQQLGRFLDEPVNRGSFANVPISLIDLDGAKAVVEPLAALTVALESARGDRRRESACAEALEGARIGRSTTPTKPGDLALLDVLTLCDSLGGLAGDAVEAPANVLGEVVRSQVVKWRHFQKEGHRGISLYYKPIGENRKRSFVFTPGYEVQDDARYRTLALSQATGWDRIALRPLAPADL